MRPRSILVPLDGSPSAEAVLPVVLPLASQLQARLILIAVHEPGIPARGASGHPALDRLIDEESRAAMGAYLHDVAVRIGSDRGEVETVVLQGSPSEQIAAYAREAGISLLALASHGRGGWSRFWLGSVTERLLRSVEVPLLVVKAQEHRAAPAASRPPYRVLVPLDGGTTAELAIETVLEVLGEAPVEYGLIRVACCLHPMVRKLASTEAVARDNQEQELVARTYVDATTARLRERGLAVRGIVRMGDDVAKEVFAEAAAAGAGLIALTTHGAGLVGRILVGSVADRIIRGSPVPVLVRRIVQPEPTRYVMPSAQAARAHAGVGGGRAERW